MIKCMYVHITGILVCMKLCACLYIACACEHACMTYMFADLCVHIGMCVNASICVYVWAASMKTSMHVCAQMFITIFAKCMHVSN